jgi:uncharacterized membrane protein
MMKKTLDNQNFAQVQQQVKDVKSVGNGDLFQLLSKASSQQEEWMKSTKAMEIPGVGCVVQVTTQQGIQIAEAVCFIPGVKIVNDINAGKKLIAIE